MGDPKPAVNPRARRDRLVVRELPGEVVVYDLERHRAHCLNPTAALVFQSADGEATVDDLAGILRRDLGVSHADRLVWLALDRLEGAHLLDDTPEPPAELARHSRRDLLRRAGLAAALLPAVASILAPTPAEAAATCVQGDAGCAGQPFGTPCYNTNPADCGVNCACDAVGTCDALGGSPCP
jgi:hypothetical protein